MKLLAMWLIAWAVCSLGSAMVFVCWIHVMKQRTLSDDRLPLHP